MRTMDDWELLQEYANGASEAAFAELVQHHLNWVYSGGHTVETHRANIMHKLGLNSTAELVNYAIGHGLVQS